MPWIWWFLTGKAINKLKNFWPPGCSGSLQRWKVPQEAISRRKRIISGSSSWLQKKESEILLKIAWRLLHTEFPLKHMSHSWGWLTWAMCQGYRYVWSCHSNMIDVFLINNFLPLKCHLGGLSKLLKLSDLSKRKQQQQQQKLFARQLWGYNILNYFYWQFFYASWDDHLLYLYVCTALFC